MISSGSPRGASEWTTVGTKSLALDEGANARVDLAAETAIATAIATTETETQNHDGRASVRALGRE